MMFGLEQEETRALGKSSVDAVEFLRSQLTSVGMPPNTETVQIAFYSSSLRCKHFG